MTRPTNLNEVKLIFYFLSYQKGETKHVDCIILFHSQKWSFNLTRVGDLTGQQVGSDLCEEQLHFPPLPP